MTHLFNKKVTIVRPIKTDTAFGASESTSNLYADLPCRFLNPKTSEREYWQRQGRVIETNMICRTITISDSDRVVYDSKTYEIISISPVIKSSGSFMKIALGYTL